MYPNLNQMPDWEEPAHQQQAPAPSAVLYTLLQSLGLLPPPPSSQPSAPPAASAPRPPPQEQPTAPPPPPPYTAPPPTDGGPWHFASAQTCPPPAWGVRNGPPPPQPTTFDWWSCNGDGRPRAPLGDILRRTGSLMSFSVVALLLLLLTPSWLFRVGAYLVLAGWLGLHVPTLLVGHVLYLVVSGLACAEPLLAVGLLLWAAHKRLVRRQPLVDRDYWRVHLARNF